MQQSLSIDFAEAARRVDKIVNNIEEKPFKADINIEQRKRALNDVWGSANAPLIATEYLKGRGIPADIVSKVQDVRGHKNLVYIGENKERMFRRAGAEWRAAFKALRHPDSERSQRRGPQQAHRLDGNHQALRRSSLRYVSTEAD